MDKVDILILGIARWAEINSIVAQYKGLPGDEDFEWLGDKPLPPESELLALGEAAMLDAAKHSAVQSVISDMERQLAAAGVPSPYLLFGTNAPLAGAQPIIDAALQKISAINSANSVDAVAQITNQSGPINA